MPRRMHVVGAFARTGKARDAVVGAQRVEAVAPPRHELVRIRLMSHVEDELVLGSVDEAVHGEDDLHRAERRGDMSACLRRGGDDLLADLLGEDAQLVLG